MARDLTTVIEDVLAADSHNVWFAADIHLADGTFLMRCAEIELTVSSLNLIGASVAVLPVVYPALLKENPQIKFSRGKAPSGGSMSITDIDNVLGEVASELESVLSDARVVVTTCFEKPDLTFEADIYFIGRIRDVKALDTEATFNLVADTDTRTAYVAGRSLTQRCLAIFGDDKCRRPAELIAPGETCSNIFDDAENGCLSKRWQFAFWGVPLFASIENFSSGGGTGWEPGGGPGGSNGPGGGGGCPNVENFISILDAAGKRAALRVKNLKEGMLVMDALKRVAIADKVEFFEAKRMMRLKCANGAVTECTEEEPLISSIFDQDGKRADKYAKGEKLLTFDMKEEKHDTSEIVSIERIAGDFMFARIMLSNGSAAHYLSGVDSSKMIERHNKIVIEPWPTS